MTYPWASGEVLTAADLNAYAGLVLVKTQTIGTAVSSVTVNDAFSSTFDNYKIIVSNVTQSTANDIVLQLAASGTPSTASYYWATAYVTYSTNAVTGTGGGTPRADYPISSINNTNHRHSSDVTVFGPFQTIRTNIAGTMYVGRTDIAGLGTAGMHDVASSYDGFKLIANAGTLTGGTIRVYGYNNG